MADRRPPLQHYFSAEPAVASRPRTRTVQLPDQSLVLHTDRGVFSAGGLDQGTAILLREAPPPPATGAILDLGCGHGVIAIALARRAPGARVVAVDVNRRALELTRLNAAENGTPTVEVCEPGDVDPHLRFAAVYSNPPIRVGRDQLLELLTMWCNRLEPGGHAYFVVQRHLGADSLAGRLREAGFDVRRIGSKHAFRLIDVRTDTPTRHHP
jgi:16S rRNA (guanine1207-N2)-methyltransferase